MVVEAATWWTYVGEDEVENRPKIKRKVGVKPFCPPYLSQNVRVWKMKLHRSDTRCLKTWCASLVRIG